MKKITFTLELSHTSDELFFFIGEFQRLADENKSFILCFKEGSKVYIKTCKELLESAFVCIYDKIDLDWTLSAINYAISIQAKAKIDFKTYNKYTDCTGVFLFITFSDEVSFMTTDKITHFADSLSSEIDYQIEDF